MGEVFFGRSPGGRAVAVKLIRAELAADPEFRRRFRLEVEAARRVGGFHTAPVVDADADADPPWMVTAYVAGPSLATVLAETGALSAEAITELGAGLAEALGAIHACGLVHRDLKPSNILMAEDGPRVIDFGVARAADASGVTGYVGTPGFMSPEQVSGVGVGAASDVFAFGGVLAQAAGVRPFGEGGGAALAYRIVHREPDLSRLDHGLREVVARCLAKDPAQRPTPEELLDHFTGRDHAPETVLDPPARTPSRRRLPVGLVAGVVAAVVVSVVLVALWRTDKGAAGGKQPGAYVTEISGAREFGSSALRLSPDGRVLAVGSGEAAELRDVRTGRQIGRTLRGHGGGTYGGAVTDFAFTPDGQTVATSSQDGTVRFWKTSDGSPAGEPLPATAVGGTTGWNTGIAYSPDGTILATVGLLGTTLWDVRKHQKIANLGQDSGTWQVRFSPDGRTLVAVGQSGSLSWWDVSTHRKITALKIGKDNVFGVAIRPDGAVVATGEQAHGQVRSWSMTTHQQIGPALPAFPDSEVRDVAFSPDGRMLAAAGGGGVRLWDATSGDPIGTRLEAPSVQRIVFTPDGTHLLAAAGKIRIFDLTHLS